MHPADIVEAAALFFKAQRLAKNWRRSAFCTMLALLCLMGLTIGMLMAVVVMTKVGVRGSRARRGALMAWCTRVRCAHTLSSTSTHATTTGPPLQDTAVSSNGYLVHRLYGFGWSTKTGTTSDSSVAGSRGYATVISDLQQLITVEGRTDVASGFVSSNVPLMRLLDLRHVSLR